MSSGNYLLDRWESEQNKEKRYDREYCVMCECSPCECENED